MRKQPGPHYHDFPDSEDSYSNKENESEPEVISVRCPFLVKEHVDCKDRDGHWRNGEVLKIRHYDLRIHYTGTSLANDEMIDYRTGRVQKQWDGRQPLRVNNRVDVKGDSDDWYEAVVEDIKGDRICVYNARNPEEKEWVRRNSGRIAPVGKYSGAFGKAMCYEFENFVFKEDQKRSHENGHRKPLVKKSVEEMKKQAPTLYQSLKNKEIQFEHKLAAKGLQIKEVAGDGNCLFRAVSDQLYGSEDFHEVLREWCMNYIEVEKEYFSQYIIGGMEAFEEYIAYKRQNSVWGDDLEIEALSEMYGLPVEIYAYDDKPMRTFHEASTSSTSTSGTKPACLSYHGRSHFNSIVPLNSPQEPLIKSKPGEVESTAVEKAKTRRVRREAHEEEKEHSETTSLNKARATFDEHGRRDMEAAFLEAILSQKEESINGSLEEAKKVSEAVQIDKDYTQITIQTSLKEIEEQEKAKLNQAILESVVTQLKSMPESVRLVMVQGYSYEDAMEAFRVAGDNPDLMMNYLLDRR